MCTPSRSCGLAEVPSGCGIKKQFLWPLHQEAQGVLVSSNSRTIFLTFLPSLIFSFLFSSPHSPVVVPVPVSTRHIQPFTLFTLYRSFFLISSFFSLSHSFPSPCFLLASYHYIPFPCYLLHPLVYFPAFPFSLPLIPCGEWGSSIPVREEVWRWTATCGCDVIWHFLSRCITSLYAQTVGVEEARGGGEGGGHWHWEQATVVGR